MATIKSYTDLEQSKKLAEILPIESADMVLLHEEPYETSDSKFDGLHQALCVPFSKYDKSWRQKYKNISYFPCWSLAALLGVLPNKIISHETAFEEEDAENINEIYYKRIESNEEGSYVCCYVGNGYKYRCIADNLVDACVAMIEKLHELKML